MSELAPVPHPAADSSISAINKKLNVSVLLERSDFGTVLVANCKESSILV
jgi:hypothetical protein